MVGPTMRTRDLVPLSRQLPTVVLARRVPGGAVDVVGTDDIDGARQATEHLIAQGHHRILHIDGGRAERRRGYRQALVAAGLDPMPFVSGGLTEMAGARAGTTVAGMLRRRQGKLSAVFVFNDQCALGLLQVVRAAGFTVPDDLAVVGYDHSRVARLPWVELTTIGQDVQQLAKKAVAGHRARLSPSGSTRDDRSPRTGGQEYVMHPWRCIGADLIGGCALSRHPLASKLIGKHVCEDGSRSCVIAHKIWGSAHRVAAGTDVVITLGPRLDVQKHR